MPLDGPIKFKRAFLPTLTTTPTPVPIPDNASPPLQAYEMVIDSVTGRCWVIGNPISPQTGLQARMVTPYSREEVTQGSGNYTSITISDKANFTDGGKLLVEGTGKFAFQNAPYLESLLSAPMLGTDATGRVQAVTSAPALTITAKNNTASPITKGTVVRISGAQGQNPTIAPAQANAYATSDAIGIAAETISNIGQAVGKVMVAGTLEGVDTNAFTDGATLYLSATTAGALTSTEPVKPNWQMQIGTVEHSHPTQGKILINAHLESTKTEYITDMTDAGEALATLAPMAEFTLLGRGSGFGSGNPEVITIGYGNSMTGTGTTLSTALSHSSSFIVADFTLVNATQFYDITTLSLAAGVWVVQASAVFTSITAAATTQYTLDIYNSTSATSLACSSASHGAAANLFTNASCCVVVSLASTSTIAMRGAASVASRTVKYQSSIGGLSNATGLVAMRIR
jgi:hypothetical protein